MARLQILELPEGASDDRPPFVLVVDQVEPQRYVLGAAMEGQPSHWDAIAERIGARSAIVTPDTIEIPANEVPIGPDGYPVRVRVEGDFEQFHGQAAAELGAVQSEIDRMDAVTDALGLDRLRDWDAIVSAARTFRSAAEEGGHRFGGPGANDPVVCSVCRLDKMAWLRGDVRTCEVVRIDNSAGHKFHLTGMGGQLRCYLCGTDRIAWAASREAHPCGAVQSDGGEV